MERNESARRVSFVGKRYSIAWSFAKDDVAYSLHRTGVGVCSNELECVAFASSRDFTRFDPSRGDHVPFFYANLHLCVPSVRDECACRFQLRTDERRGRQTRKPHRHRKFELCILDHCIVNLVYMVLAQLQLLVRVLARHAEV